MLLQEFENGVYENIWV